MVIVDLGRPHAHLMHLPSSWLTTSAVSELRQLLVGIALPWSELECMRPHHWQCQ